MSDFAVKIDNIHVYDMIRKLAIDAGYQSDYGGLVLTNRNCVRELFFVPKNKYVEWSGENHKNYFVKMNYVKEYSSLDYVVKVLSLPLIKIGDYIVEFNQGSIKVGCTEVPNETVKKIYERLLKS